MRILVKPDRRAPVVVVHGLVPRRQHRRSQRHDRRRARARAHDVQGHARISRRASSRARSRAAGGRDNAFTSRDYTGLLLRSCTSRSSRSRCRLEADRMANLVLSPDEFAKEIRVVMEERRWRTDDRPRSLVYEQLNGDGAQGASLSHPGRRLDERSREHARRRRARVLRKLVCAEQRDAGRGRRCRRPKKSSSSREQHFGPIAAQERCRRASRRTSRRSSARSESTVKAPAELPYVLMAYRAPALRDPEKDWEPYALEMLADVLDGNEAARLNRDARAHRAHRDVSRTRATTASAAGPACSISSGDADAGQDGRRRRAGACGARCAKSSTTASPRTSCSA